MRLADILRPDCIKIPLEATDKRGAIFELADLLAQRGLISDAEGFKRAVWQREVTRTTGIGHGLAIPHGKAAACDRLVMAVGKPDRPIDFQSLDGRPVRLIFLLGSPPDQTGPHIQALAQISRLMSREPFRQTALDAPDAETLHELITQQDNVAVE